MKLASLLGAQELSQQISNLSEIFPSILRELSLGLLAKVEKNLIFDPYCNESYGE